MCDYENDHLCRDEIDEDLDWDDEDEWDDDCENECEEDNADDDWDDTCYPEDLDPMSQGY